MRVGRVEPAIYMLILLVGLWVEGAQAEAYCALRDPVQHIYELYPEADSYRSIVRKVDRSIREVVGERLPFTLHPNELGTHTLYCAMGKDGAPIGLIHVRSEKGEWGLSEIAWSLDFDLRIRDFRFQRCRSRHAKHLEGSEFVDQLRYQDLETLRSFLDEDGDSLRHDDLTVKPGAEELATMVLHSALKTIVVTELVWGEDLQQLRMQRQPEISKLIKSAVR